MSLPKEPFIAVCVALAFSLIVTPIARRIALKTGLIDHPDAHRKLHREPIALCGGIVILFCLFASISVLAMFAPEVNTLIQANFYTALSLVIGAVGIVVLGVLDDRFGLRGRQKLFGQVLICCSIMAFGFTIDSFEILGLPVIELGLLAIPVTLGWMLLSINSVNLIDGADGLCSSVGWIACAALSVIGWWTGNHMESVVAAVLAGSLLGFLYFNLPPAKVFLGDSGSMLIGLILSVLTMRSWTGNNNAFSIAVPIVLMSVPLFDSMMAILRRKLTGRSVFTVDRGHLHHNLMRRGITNRSLVGVITLLCGITAGGAVLGVIFKADWISLGTMLFALGTLVFTRVFGFAELELLSKRGFHFSKSLISRGKKSGQSSRQQMVRLQGSRRWDTVWNTLVEFSEKHEIAKLSLDLNVPWLHEGFHANWHKNRLPEFSERWSVRIPMIHEGRILGSIEIVGKQQGAATYSTVSLLADLMESLQPDIRCVIEDFQQPETSVPVSVPASDEDTIDSASALFDTQENLLAITVRSEDTRVAS